MKTVIIRNGDGYVKIFINGTWNKISESTDPDEYGKIVEMANKLVNGIGDADEYTNLYNELASRIARYYQNTLPLDDNFVLSEGGVVYARVKNDETGEKVIIKKGIPPALANEIKSAVENGESTEHLLKFWLRLLLNRNIQLREDLFSFLNHRGHQITNEGYFVAYKAVDVAKKYDKNTGKEVVEYDENTGEPLKPAITTESIFTPIYKGGKYGNRIKIGEPVSMPMSDVDKDRYSTCSDGLHVGSIEYVEQYGYSDSIILEVLVDPMNVGSIPVDYDQTKMRVSEYFPVSIYKGGENTKIYTERDYKPYSAENVKREVLRNKERIEKEIEALRDEIKTNDLILSVVGGYKKDEE